MSKIILNLKLLFLPCSENNYRPKFLSDRFLACYVAILIVLKLLILPIFVLFPENIFFAEISETVLIALINEERGEYNLPPLEENALLDASAQLKANHMLAYGYFSHNSPSGITPWYWFKKAGYDYKTAGENLAVGFLDSEELLQAWNNSPSHRANLLNPNYKDIGIAVVNGSFQGDKTSIVVQTFGSPKESVLPKESAVQKQEITEEKEEANLTEKEVLPLPKEEAAAETGEEVAEKKVAGTAEKSALTLKSYPNEEIKDSLYFNFWKFISANYYDLIQKIIFYSFLFIIFSLIVNILVKINIQRADLILKTIFFLALLFGFYLLDKIYLIQLIPHNLIIS